MFKGDLKGKKFGLLTAVRDAGITPLGSSWVCQCECGREIYCTAKKLLKGKTCSCGCLKESYGEFRIKRYLVINQIPFEREKTFKGCCYPDTGGQASFDFYVNNSYLVEYDGPPHTTQDCHHYNTKRYRDKVKQRDDFKDQWCREHHIPLVRISYLDIEHLTLPALMEDT